MSDPADVLDYPTAWRIQRETAGLVHDQRCSATPPEEGGPALGGAMWLCDCGAVVDEWERTKALLDQSSVVVSPAAPATAVGADAGKSSDAAGEELAPPRRLLPGPTTAEEKA